MRFQGLRHGAGGDLMIIMIEILQVLAIALLVFSSFMYLNDLNKRKKQRKWSTFESVMFVILQVAILMLVVSWLVQAFMD